MAENTLVRNGNAPARSEATRNTQFFAPRVDILETDGELLLLADLPGVNPSDIDLRYERGDLILRGTVAPATPRGEPLVHEYDCGDFYRLFQIHETIDASARSWRITGAGADHLPKQEAVKPKQVQVHAG